MWKICTKRERQIDLIMDFEGQSPSPQQVICETERGQLLLVHLNR
jgi:hypothetical protein